MDFPSIISTIKYVLRRYATLPQCCGSSYDTRSANHDLETTLPQIIQALGPGASRTKAIILLPQSNNQPLPAGMGPPPLPTGPSPFPAIAATGANAIDPVIAPLNPVSPHPLACQCGSGSMPGSPGSVGGMDWMGSAASSMCPVHGGQGNGMESHQMTML